MGEKKCNNYTHSQTVEKQKKRENLEGIHMKLPAWWYRISGYTWIYTEIFIDVWKYTQVSMHMIFSCSVNWEDLEAKTSHQQWAQLASISWSLIKFSSKRNQKSFEKWLIVSAGAVNVQMSPEHLADQNVKKC